MFAYHAFLVCLTGYKEEKMLKQTFRKKRQEKKSQTIMRSAEMLLLWPLKCLTEIEFCSVDCCWTVRSMFNQARNHIWGCGFCINEYKWVNNHLHVTRYWLIHTADCIYIFSNIYLNKFTDRTTDKLFFLKSLSNLFFGYKKQQEHRTKIQLHVQTSVFNGDASQTWKI